MKIVAIIPIKKKSVRVKNKNFRLINKKPLYEYTLEKLKYCKLATKNANGNNLLLYHSKIIEADIYFQIFVTSPLLKISTINNCINILKKNREKYDSILTIHTGIHSTPVCPGSVTRASRCCKVTVTAPPTPLQVQLLIFIRA